MSSAVQRFAVEGAEAFIKKQESIRLMAHQSDSARASAADEETFAAGRVRVSHGVTCRIDNLQLSSASLALRCSR